jgi:hypothetical protein
MYPIFELTQVSRDRDYLYRLGRNKQVLPEDGDRIQSPKRCVLKNKQECF